eukprot:3445815-Pleurochrysis_carterae.AAC.1
METLQAEMDAPPAAEPTAAVAAVSRLVAAPRYGEAAWAAIYSNLKYTGVLPGEGVVPASVIAARQGLHTLILSRIEEVVGEERLAGVEAEVAKLAEA